MSVSPAQNFSKPPPVPEVPTVIFTSGFSAWNSSAAAWANGPTVLEPSMRMSPERSPPPPPLRAAVVVVVAAAGRYSESEHAADGQREELPHWVFSLVWFMSA